MLVQGDAVRIPLADESVHCVVTSPPYWGLRKYAGNMARVWGGDAGCKHEWGEEVIKPGITGGTDNPFADKLKIKGQENYQAFPDSTSQFCLRCGAWYGELGLEPTPEQYVENMVAVFREVRRVLRADGTCWVNLGDSYIGSPPGTRGKHAQGIEGDGLYKRYWDRQLSHGEDKRAIYRQPEGLKPKDLAGIPWRVAFALQADGWWLRSDIIWAKPNPMPESVTDRPTKAHEYLFLLSKSARYYYDADAVREEHKDINRVQAEIEGQHRRRDIDNSYLNIGNEMVNHSTKWGGNNNANPSGRNRRTVWTIATAPYSGAHFATYPPALVEPCIKAGTSERGCCPECGSPWERVVEKHAELEPQRNVIGIGPKTIQGGGEGTTLHHIVKRDTLGWQPNCSHDTKPVPCTVLDPFAGSGTTLQVARSLGRHGVGLDLSAEYLQLARQRLELDKLDAWTSGLRKNGDEQEYEGHKNMQVPGRQPHSFHVARVKDKSDDDLAELPLFGEL